MLRAGEACCHRVPGREAAGRGSQPRRAYCCHCVQQPHRIGSRRRAPTARPRRRRALLPFPDVREEARTRHVPPPSPCAAGASAGARSGGGGARPPSRPGTPVAALMSEPCARRRRVSAAAVRSPWSSPRRWQLLAESVQLLRLHAQVEDEEAPRDRGAAPPAARRAAGGADPSCRCRARGDGRARDACTPRTPPPPQGSRT